MRTIVLTLLVVLTTESTASADLLLDLEYADGTAHKVIKSGDTVMVDLILRDPSDDTLISAEGLGSGGGAIVQTAGAAMVASTGFPIEGPGFDPLFTAPSPGFPFPPAVPRPGLVDSIFASNPIIPVGFGATDVLIGTFTLVAMGAVGDTATLSADTLDVGPLHLLFGNETFTTTTNLDLLLTELPTTPGNFGSVTLEIAPVPEPSTIACGFLIAGTLVWRRRKTASA